MSALTLSIHTSRRDRRIYRAVERRGVSITALTKQHVYPGQIWRLPGMSWRNGGTPRNISASFPCRCTFRTPRYRHRRYPRRRRTVDIQMANFPTAESRKRHTPARTRGRDECTPPFRPDHARGSPRRTLNTSARIAGILQYTALWLDSRQWWWPSESPFELKV